ncbi:MAG TPA: hypothetical protein VK694_03200 [Verrucomicrobiae bacterium]|nr:hypothetical protein [Verrucomicrobiae bacterium]
MRDVRAGNDPLVVLVTLLAGYPDTDLCRPEQHKGWHGAEGHVQVEVVQPVAGGLEGVVPGLEAGRTPYVQGYLALATMSLGAFADQADGMLQAGFEADDRLDALHFGNGLLELGLHRQIGVLGNTQHDTLGAEPDVLANLGVGAEGQDVGRSGHVVEDDVCAVLRSLLPVGLADVGGQAALLAFGCQDGAVEPFGQKAVGVGSPVGRLLVDLVGPRQCASQEQGAVALLADNFGGQTLL